MELEEAYRIMTVSPEERASIERYLGFKHTSINILADMTPGNYKRLDNAGWKLPETEDEIKDSITDFINIYAAMYKESKGRDTRMNLIRGTSRRNIPSMREEIHQMLSTSTDESIAKRFCEYGNAALIRFHVEEGVPFLDAEKYRDENAATEDEIILAPFCCVIKNERMGEFNGYDYYNISIGKTQLEEPKDDDIETVMKEVVSGFSQNIEDMQMVNSLSEEYEVLTEKTRRGIPDREDQIYVSKRMHELLEQYGEEGKKINHFKERLQFLLKGLCKQKEIEIDRAQQVIDEENKRIAEERRVRIEEERKVIEAEESKKLFSELSAKALQMPMQTESLLGILKETYRKLLEIEQSYKGIATRFQIPYRRLISATDIADKIRKVQENLDNLQKKARETTFSEDDSLESMRQVSSVVTPIFDSVAYSLEIAHDIPEIANMYQNQSDKEIKRNLYMKVQSVIQEARIDKYLKDRELIETEGIHFFDGITGRSDLQIERLNNINLKIQLAQCMVPKEQEYYSVRDMLADLYACGVAELGGTFTPKMQQLYEDMKNVYGDTRTGGFSDEYIGQLAREKIVNGQKNLPIMPETRTHFWGRTKSQIELLRLENQNIEIQIGQERNKSASARYDWTEKDAIALFDFKVKGIQVTTTDKSQVVQSKNKHQTFDLWG